MGFTQSAQQVQDQISHKAEILRLIKKTNDKIADFNEAPTVLNAYTQQTTYIEQAQRGKEIALAVQVLFINTRSVLPLKFFQDMKIQNLHAQAFQKQGEGKEAVYLFLVEDSVKQYEGIIKILIFYQKLLDAIYSLPDFSDVLMMNTKKQKKRQDMNEDEEDEIFDL